MIVLASKSQILLGKLKKIIPQSNIIFFNQNYLIAQTSNGLVQHQEENGDIFQAEFTPQKHYESEKILLSLNKNRGELSIQRDRIEFQHLYFAKFSAGVLISNSLRVIASVKKLLGETNSFNEDGLTSYLTFQYIPYTETIIKGVIQVPPGGQLTINESLDLKIQIDWLKISPRKGLKHENILNTTKEVKKLFANSLQERVKNTKHIGCYLSGGMDTSTNVALLVEDLGVKPTVFTASFTEPQYDELADAKIVSKKFGLKHFTTKVLPKDILRLHNIVDCLDSPIADRAILPQYLITLLAKEKNIGTMISGEGGDEIFGYPRRLSDTQGETIAKQHELSNHSLAKYYLRFTGLFTKDELETLLGENREVIYSKQLTTIYQTFPRSVNNNFEKIYYGQWKTWLIDNVLVKDKSICDSMRIKSANPFISTPIMEFMASLPIKEKLILLRNKHLLRNMMANYLPERIIRKRKHKFHVPLARWFRESLYEFLHDSLLSIHSVVSTMFEKKFIEQLISSHKRGIQDNNRKLWALLFLEYWIVSFRNLEKSAKMLKYLN